jgi:hypothetical protein
MPAGYNPFDLLLQVTEVEARQVSKGAMGWSSQRKFTQFNSVELLLVLVNSKHNCVVECSEHSRLLRHAKQRQLRGFGDVGEGKAACK